MAPDRREAPESPISATKPEKSRPAVKIVAALLYSIAFIVFIILAEVVVRVEMNSDSVVPGAVRAPLYSDEELRRDLPRYTERQGGSCLTLETGFHWDPRFGFTRKKLDKACAEKLFASHKTSVVLLGGSAMDNAEAPNYLTSIDTYAFGNDPSIASLNLAESGARHSNMLFRILYEVLELHPKYIVFLDGFNEFTSIRYGGLPDGDFYWTAGVKERVHRPLIFFRDKLFESSKLLELLALKTGLINSARMPRSHIEPRSAREAAQYYVKTRAFTEALCRTYGIKCIFIIQPTALLEKNPSKSVKLIIEQDLRSFPFDVDLYRIGYEYILSQLGGKVLDATHLFDGNGDVYIDVVHFNKLGSKRMGEYIRASMH